MKAIVLMSGGLDSTTVLAYAISEGYDVIGISFDYGQRHRIELESSKKIAEHYGIERRVFKIDLTQIGGSSLTSNIDVEEGKIGREEVPNTYVPARNIVFLSIAGAYADIDDIDTIMIGVNAVDYSGYPDCRPEFISSMERSLRLGLSRRQNLKILAPLQRMSKAEIIKMGMNLKAPYELTHSCYEGGSKACGKCDSCLLRLKGFMESGFVDPIQYEEYPEFYIEYLKEKKLTN
ncbi:7-cyano-7-deazaguanine synthase QueC [Cuniculiplasma sp. SKW3]|uniref:7-cyano-7-deazaguanine synthase QueC n=1 Tax=Cuniculiplasma sp. SKW3 TaxID=3400170 RepID=UPI003FD4960B